MTPEERKDLGIHIAMLAEYYGKPMRREVIGMMVDDLNDLDFEKVKQAYQGYRLNPKNRTMPLPAQIRAILNPVTTPDQAGREISSLILEAITRFGYSNQDEARQHIGEIGWSIVRSFGGWNYLCENVGVNIQPSQFIAQCRDIGSDRFEHGPSLSALVKSIPYERERVSELDWQDKKQGEIQKAIEHFKIKEVPR